MNPPSGFSSSLVNVLTALIWPLILWTVVVIAITLFGYPGVICATPVAWSLSFAVGERLRQTSQSSRSQLIFEGLAAGALLGLWQGLLASMVIAASKYLPGGDLSSDLPSPVFTATLLILTSVPVTAAVTAVYLFFTTRSQAAE